MSPAKKRKTCSREGCKQKPVKAGKCGAHYMADYRQNIRVRREVDLGEDPGHLDFWAPRDDVDTFHKHVPEGDRSKALRAIFGVYVAGLRAREG